MFYTVLCFPLLTGPQDLKALINGHRAARPGSANIYDITPMSLARQILWMIYGIDINLLPVNALPKLENGEELMLQR